MAFPLDTGDLEWIDKIEYTLYAAVTEADEYYIKVAVEPSNPEHLEGSMDDLMALVESSLTSLSSSLITLGATDVRVSRTIGAQHGDELLNLPAE